MPAKVEMMPVAASTFLILLSVKSSITIFPASSIAIS
jgi:hypothetical protein